MRYRLYEQEDFELLYAIEEACFEPPFRFDRALMHSLVRRALGAAWIAEVDGRMAGFAIVAWTRRKERREAYIQTIEVLPGERTRGVGRALLSRCEGSARGAGAEVVWLHVAESNTAAIRLYESRGYLREGRLEDYYPAGGSAFILVKRLEG